MADVGAILLQFSRKAQKGEGRAAQFLQKEQQIRNVVSTGEDLSSRNFGLFTIRTSDLRGESAVGQLLIGEGFVRTARPPFQMT